jgi:antitoxin component of MazEF toxin-antitoxin module
MRVRGRIRKMGNSLGLIIPKDEVERHKLAEGDIVELEVERRANVRELFGALKFKEETQKLKDEARRGWNE